MKLFYLRAINPILFVISCLLIASFSANAAATCPEMLTFKLPATIKINPAASVGTVLYSYTVMASNNSNRCPLVNVINTYYQGVGTPDGNNYPTNIPGVSYRISPTTGTSLLAPSINSVTSGNSNGPTHWNGGTWITYLLVKTGPIVMGTLAPGLVLSESDNSFDAPVVAQFFLGSSVVINPVTPTCTATAVVTVTLPPVTKDSFSNVGDTAGEKTFPISLSCSSSVNIGLAFSGTVIDSNNAVFGNTDATTGSSVGVQILKDSNPVPMGVGNYIQLGLVNGPVVTNFSAKYYALNSPVVEGNVSSVVYATIVYN